MIRRRMFLTSFATAVLSVTIAIPTLAAAPTFSGLLTCLDAVTGEVRDLNTLNGATKHDIAVQRKFWAESGFCEKGSFDTSGLTQDP